MKGNAIEIRGGNDFKSIRWRIGFLDGRWSPSDMSAEFACICLWENPEDLQSWGIGKVDNLSLKAVLDPTLKWMNISLEQNY